MRSRRRGRRALLGLGLLTLLSGCANEVTDALIEQPLGKLSEWAISLQFRKEQDPLLHNYVQLLGGEARSLVRRKNVPYRFTVVDLQEPNAFAIPWGGIYVTKGLLRFADSEDEIAFVVGHEVGHVERRHGSLAFQRNLIVMLALNLLTSNNNEDWMQYAYLGNAFLDLHWSRENESSADREGVMYAINSGKDPARGIDFFLRLDEAYGAVPRFWGYFQTHPINRDRIAAIKQQPYLAEDAQMLTLIAEGYRQRERYSSAAQHYQRAVRADANWGPAYLGLARVAAWRGDREEARQRYQEALTHGIDAAVVDPEVAALPSGPQFDPSQPAAASDIVAARQGLDQLGVQLARVASSGQSVWNQPLDSNAALVQSHQLAGTQLDQLYDLGDKLPGSLQGMVKLSQQLRGAALRGAAEVGALQDESASAAAQLERTRQRALAKLGGNASGALLELTRRFVGDGERAAMDLRDGAQRLNEQDPAMRRAVQGSHDAIALLHHSLTGSARPSQVSDRLRSSLAAAEYALDEAVDRTEPAQMAVFGGRLRGLINSLDITMVDRPRHERSAASRLVQRFLSCTPAEAAQAYQSGLTFGEATYVLALAKSTGKPLEELLQAAGDSGRRAVLDRLARGRRSNAAAIAILLKLIDAELIGQLEPLAAGGA
ncbi:MAG: M48 family metalloprotease [Fimbriimonadaceae bacterium]|nr:M48 family metalloprotease [Fimbriimonadaceae bacterium]